MTFPTVTTCVCAAFPDAVAVRLLLGVAVRDCPSTPATKQVVKQSAPESDFISRCAAVIKMKLKDDLGTGPEAGYPV